MFTPSAKSAASCLLLCCLVGCETDTKVIVYEDGSGAVELSITVPRNTPAEQIATLKSALRKDDDAFGSGVEFQKLELDEMADQITLTATYSIKDINKTRIQGNPIGNPFNIWVGVKVIPMYDFHLEELSAKRRKLTITTPHEAFELREAARQRKLFSKLLGIIDTKLTKTELPKNGLLKNTLLNDELPKTEDFTERLVITKSVTVSGKIAETNAQYHDESTVVLHKVDYKWLLQNRATIHTLAQKEPPTAEEARQALSRLEGLRLNLEPTITVIFDVPGTREDSPD